MRPTLHPFLVNGRFGDPALFVETLHHRSAMIFDLGDLSSLSARDLLRIGHVFISHMHMDHFIGFDALLRVNVGREKQIAVFGPPGICDKIHHKLQAYEWDLVDKYEADLIFEVREIGGVGLGARFRLKRAFAREERAVETDAEQVARIGNSIVRAVMLEHHGPCLGYSVTETAHANVWKNRVEEQGLTPGPWLQELKQAVLNEAPDEHPVILPNGPAALGTVRHLVTITEGQKIAYVTDVADTPSNRERIAALAEKADTFFIESRFAAEDALQARQRAHLTTAAAGEIARRAKVRRVEPFHFSPRYAGEEDRMIAEVMGAFQQPLIGE